MGRAARVFFGIALVVGLGVAQADVLELRDGSRLEGVFRSADENSLQFETGAEIHLIPVEQARSLVFGEVAADVPQPRPQAAVPRPAPAAHPKLAETASAPAPASPAAAAPVTPSARTLQIPAGTLLRVRIGDTVDPRIGAEGDRFAGLLENGLAANGIDVIPARSRVYGVVSEARTQGPLASRLKLELTDLMLGGEMLSVVSGTHQVVDLPGGGPGPANAAPPRPDRIPAGTLLEFRLLQSVELVVR